MPNIKALHIDGNSVSVTLGDGRSATLTKAMLRNRYQQETGTRAERRQKVFDWVKEQVRQFMTDARIRPADVDFDFDENDGTPVKIEIGTNGVFG